MEIASSSDELKLKQIYEAKSENRITAVLANLAFLDGHYYPMLDNRKKGLLEDIFRTYPFRVLALTTGDIAEDPYDYLTWGDIIHFVFDFPTHAANGTFKSIYWTGGQRDDS